MGSREPQTTEQEKATIEEQLAALRLDLQRKNRELEVEAALDMVRTRTSAMRSSAELAETSAILFQQLAALQIKAIRTGVGIFDEPNNAMELWVTSYSDNEEVLKVLDYFSLYVHPVFENIIPARQQKKPYVVTLLTGNEVRQYYQTMSTYLAAPAQYNEREYYYSFFFPQGTINVVTGEALNDDECRIMIRFAQVFGLIYTRFLDLQKAEMQAREAEIEMALERVRSASMSMQQSDDLKLVIDLVKDQFIQLGFKFHAANFVTGYSEQGYTMWLASPNDKHARRIDVTQQGDNFFQPVSDAVGAGADFAVYTLDFEQKNTFFHHLFENTEAKDVPEEIKAYVFAGKGMAASVALLPKVRLNVSNLDMIPFSEEENAIIKRFAYVFEQSYTRFMDLQRAEAQAREAQIEASLERVRARSMAMHQSTDLQEVIKVIADQFNHLEINFDTVSFVKVLEDNSWDIWISTNERPYPAKVSIPYFQNKILDELNYNRSQGKTFYTGLYTYEEKNTFFHYFFEHTIARNMPEERKQYVLSKPGYAISVFATKNISLNVARYEIKPFSDTENGILKRFALVFEQAYTRFLDLQKAEAQAREAQIEVAVERVRAKALAMHKSEDLHKIVVTLKQELMGLQIPDIVAATICLEQDDGLIRVLDLSDTAEENDDQPQLKLDKVFRLEDTDPKLWIRRMWNCNESYFVHEADEEDFVRIVQLIRTIDPAGAEMAEKIITEKAIKKAWLPTVKLEKGVMNIDLLAPPAPEIESILLKMGAGFDLAYKRFLDLQKAEAQAREASIQLALERVRARTMAMHKSEELSETATVLFEQLKELGEEPERTAIGIVNEEQRVLEVWATQHGGQQMNLLFKFTIDEPHVMQKVYSTWKEKKKSIAIDLQGKELEEYYQFLRNNGVPVNHEAFTKRRVEHFAAFSKGMLVIITSEPRPPEAIALYERFASVFDLTYTRFLDLQKAEAQARESQIELGLERVRARAMAMQNSDELKELIGTVFTELTRLDLVLTRCVIMIYDGEANSSKWWMANSEDPNNPMGFNIQQHDHPPMAAYFKAWRERKVKYTYELKGQVKKDWDDFLFTETELKNLPDFVIEGMKAPDLVYLNASFNNFGNLTLASLQPLNEEHFDILLRFAKVFDLTYTRFNDLQKAEIQAREAHIEAALERVRSKTMAMHNSQEVGDTVISMFDELIKLGVEKTIRCGVAIYLNPGEIELWTAYAGKDGNITLNIGFIETNLHPLLSGGVAAWENKEAGYTYHLEGKDLLEYYTAITNAPNYTAQINLEELPSKLTHHNFYFSEGSLFAFAREPLSPEVVQLFKRFTAVFGQTYRRYLDLLRAEAQAREAQIEAGLERVRARTMAMHSSEDVSTATETMFIELEKLGIQNIRGGITIIKPDQTQEVWGINNLPEGKTIRSIGVFDMRLHPLWQDIFERQKNQEDFGYYWLGGKDKENYITLLNSTPNYLTQPIKDLPDVHVQTYLFGEGGIWTNSLEPHTEEQKQIMKRFASVFSLTFRRYLDLQKAEAQAREAQIEAGLERVRAKAMAMHDSQDLADTIGVFYKELKSFSITPRRCGVGLLDQEERIGELFTWNTTEQGESLELVGRLKMEGHPVLDGVYEHWLSQTEYHPVLRGSEINDYYKVIRPQMSFPDYQHDQAQFGYFFFFKEGGVYAWTENEMKEEELQIYRRFTSVLSLTYKRYKDLRQAEASARDALRQASLDRVRAEIASMRTVEDLQRITPVIWNELTILNIPFIRCGIFIMDEEQKLAHTFLSTPDGKAIASFHLPYETPGNLGGVIDNWRHKKRYIEHWDEAEFRQFAQILVEQGALLSAETYLKAIPKDGFYLHFLPFLQGMLYVGNIDRLNEEETELMQHIAEAFSTAYARYEDFNRLEAAKQQVEKTLTDLKQAQTQLVQSEKMASLGELTAGIAHEIQNPLNFVNNFSDVSSELLDEMVDELSKGNLSTAREIVEDVKQNLEKINYHGKRADGIVKGMLQHSRTSSGQKEMTDINALTDEYLRLAYHGLRAKDKSFNAKFETHFDDSIGKVNIIPQDIGRVILNLINNAFYAVSERKKLNGPGYEPTVSVTTQKVDDKVEIGVKDNGTGIPQKVLDKIFQPFFTTKPTGQGTGLGLSLSYDIIKGHGGELKVQTMDGEGSEFLIVLPA